MKYGLIITTTNDSLLSFSAILNAISKHKSALQSELARLKVKAGSQYNKDLLTEKLQNEVILPRYIRVNTLKTSVKDVIDHFKKEGFLQQHITSPSYESYISTVRSLAKNHFLLDIHIPELLAFGAGTDLHDHVLYKSGEIIFQDKASCIPGYVLAPPPGSEVMDCCAAPGNKTSQLAAMMQNKGKLHAFDKDPKRTATMVTMLLRSGVLCASCENIDFLRCDPESPKYKDVEYILVDPSCSGSGIVNRLNDMTDDAMSTATSRLDGLGRIQLSILVHAMTFPKVKKLVYSTCSVHQRENESVVNRALQLTGDHFKLIMVMKELPSRGKELSEPSNGFFQAKKCLRMDPVRDLTNGFFVAMFEKRKHVTDSVKDIVEQSGAKDFIHFVSKETHVKEKTECLKSPKQINSHSHDMDISENGQTNGRKQKVKGKKNKLQVIKQRVVEKTNLKPPELKSRNKKKQKRKHRPVTG